MQCCSLNSFGGLLWLRADAIGSDFFVFCLLEAGEGGSSSTTTLGLLISIYIGGTAIFFLLSDYFFLESAFAFAYSNNLLFSAPKLALSYSIYLLRFYIYYYKAFIFDWYFFYYLSYFYLTFLSYLFLSLIYFSNFSTCSCKLSLYNFSYQSYYSVINDYLIDCFFITFGE